MIHGKLDIKPTDFMLESRGLEPYGKVQKYIDNEVTKKMVPYTPMLSSTLFKSAKAEPKLGSGLIVQNTPYARFQYYGKLMVSPSTGSSWAKKHEKKVLTDINLVHNKSGHPMAGPFWFERAKADHKEDILQGARKIAGAK